MSVLPFPSFLDDIKEKGLKRAIFEGVNEVVERATAGMNVQDIREALRGEAASRKPNPRLQPHADGFWLHMRPSYFHKSVTGVYPEFRLGWLSTYFVFFETLTGIFLMIFYTPSPEVAYADMLRIMSNVPLGQFVRDLHRLGAEAMVLIVFLHMLRTFYTGSYKKPRQFTWFSGFILLFCTMFLSFSGYLLPWDQLALWAVTIGASMVEAAPPEIVGTNLNLLLRGGPDIGANGLLRFYLLHVLAVPAILFIFTGVHYYKVIVHGHSLPPKEENIGEDTAKRVPLDKRVYFIPDVLTSEIMWIAVTTLILIVLVTWFFHAPLESHADPQVTPLGTTAPWYFLWIQGALKLGDKVLWGIIFPTIVLVFLAVMPYLDTTPSRRFAHRRFAFTVSFILLSALVVLSYMGLPEFGVKTSADAEVLHEMVMEPAHNHMGKLRPVPYDQMVVGAYTTRQFEAEEGDAANVVNAFNQEIQENGELQMVLSNLASHGLPLSSINFTTVPADAPELSRVLHWYMEELHHLGAELHDAWGAVIITEAQDGLKRLDVIVVWDEVEMNNVFPVIGPDGLPVLVRDENGNPNRLVNSQYMYIHENSQYFPAPGA
ncbi:cytochrome bc complex cytochrome b subunit [Anaerolineae bacterium CFX9]|jgi:quinol-cytochrome oxidoreductase complex cytochrome b subunit|nr:cytochrome bc complex cytochrome b subunit [Anaerolineae bacterium CFX9]